MTRWLWFAAGCLVGYVLYETLYREPERTYHDDKPYVLPTDERFIDLWAEAYGAGTS